MDLDVHCIADNYASHKHPKVRAWLAQRPRWHMHFVPTYSGWRNQVERFFAIITDTAIRSSERQLWGDEFMVASVADGSVTSARQRQS